MSHVFHRTPQADPPLAVRGEGIRIFDRDGKAYLDGSGGAAVSCLGHDHPRIREAMKAQLDRLAYAHTAFFSTEAAEALADALIAGAPAGMSRVYFVSGGSEAVETALKMARQYFVEIGQPQRRHIVARWQSYHGNTLGALAAGGNLWRRKAFEPLLFGSAHHIAPCYAYRDRQPDETEDAYGLRVADELDATIRRLGPDTVAAFIAEPVVGATLGCVPATPGYFARIREICDRHGVLLILDEVMCGMGRTGTLHACEQEGIAPDLLVVAKGLGAGYQPIGAVLVAGRIYDAFACGAGFLHGHTYMAHALACAAALEVQRVIRDENLLDNVRRQGARLTERLTERFGNHRHVGDIRGRGLFQAIELVADRASTAPFDPALKVNQRIKREAMGRGLLCYPMGGTVDGRAGDHVLLAPAFIVQDHEIDAIVERLGDAVDAAVAGSRA